MQSRKRIIFDAFPVFLLFLIITIFFVLLIIVCLNFNVILFSTFLSISLVFIFFMFLLVNVSAPIIIYQEGQITRRGFFCGFTKTIKKEDIISVKHSRIGRIEFYELCDGKSIPWSLLRKQSTIKVPYSDKGREFLKDFWEKEILDD